MSVVRGSNQLLRPLFLLSFSSFLKLKFPNTLSIKVADNKIRATCVWCQKSLLCQLSYYLCPSLQTHFTYNRIHGMYKFLMTTFLSNVAKLLATFGAILKNLTLVKKLYGYFFGYLWKHLDYFYSNICSHCTYACIISLPGNNLFPIYLLENRKLDLTPT